MFVVALVLFILPCSLLWLAWKRSAQSRHGAEPVLWRIRCGDSALVLALCSTALELVFFYSWFRNGGSPHGMMPGPGIWMFVGKVSGACLLGSLVLAAFGKGRWRVFILAWALSYAVVVYVIFMLQMD